MQAIEERGDNQHGSSNLDGNVILNTDTSERATDDRCTDLFRMWYTYGTYFSNSLQLFTSFLQRVVCPPSLPLVFQELKKACCYLSARTRLSTAAGSWSKPLERRSLCSSLSPISIIFHLDLKMLV
jgi:hypothetical protein